MVDQPKSLAEQLQEVELANAKVTLKLEQRKLKWWYVAVQAIGSPALIAAVVTAAVTFAFNWYSQKQTELQNKAAQDQAIIQKETETLRLHQESDKAILLGLIGQKDPALIASQLRVFLNAGLIYDSPHFHDTINKLEQQPREGILQNIIRASSDLPLDFGTGVRLTRMLEPIDLATLVFFLSEGFPRELLFWLFIDSFEVNVGRSGSFGYRYNTFDYGCSSIDPKHRCYIDWVHLVTLAGLTVEGKSVLEPGGNHNKGDNLDRKITPSVFERFCFSKIAAEGSQTVVRETNPELLLRLRSILDVPLDALYNDAIRCGGPWNPIDDITNAQRRFPPVASGPFNLRLITRSTYATFGLLGTLLKMQRKAAIPVDRSEAAAALPILSTVPADFNLLTVLPNDSVACFVHTSFDNSEYCVPEVATTTKQVFNILGQLITIAGE